MRKVSAPEYSGTPIDRLRSPPITSRRFNLETHARRKSVNLYRNPMEEREEVRKAESVTSEPAYSRLRSELYNRSRRGMSEEPEDRGGGTSELVRQLRGALQ